MKLVFETTSKGSIQIRECRSRTFAVARIDWRNEALPEYMVIQAVFMADVLPVQLPQYGLPAMPSQIY